MKAVVLKKRAWRYPDGSFTVIGNEVFKNKKLSLKALGLYCLIWSLPETWSYTASGIALLVRDSPGSIRAGANELEDAGFLRIEVNRKDGKYSGCDCMIFDPPNKEKPNPVKPNPVKPNPIKPNPVKPNQVKPNQVKPNQVNRPQVINNKLNTDKEIKKGEIKRMKIPPGFENGIPDDRIIF